MASALTSDFDICGGLAEGRMRGCDVEIIPWDERHGAVRDECDGWMEGWV